MMFAFTANVEGGADADILVRTHPLTRHIGESSIDVMVFAGYAAYLRLAQRSVDPLMPDSNGYHIACTEASLRWLQRRAAERKVRSVAPALIDLYGYTLVRQFEMVHGVYPGLTA